MRLCRKTRGGVLDRPLPTDNKRLNGTPFSLLGFLIAIAYPNRVSNTPAATAEPMTPATLGPMACISRKLEGLAF